MQDQGTVQQAPAQSGAPKGLGIASIICGGVGLCVPGLAFVGVILGVIGLAIAKPGGKKLPGIGTGVSGGVLVLNILLMVALLLPALNAARSEARMVQSLSNLRQISVSYHAYAADHNGRYPDHPEDLLPYAYGSTDIFIAPGDDAATLTMTRPSTKPTRPFLYGSYEFMPLGGVSVDQIPGPGMFIIAYSNEPVGPDDRYIIAVFADGHAEALELNEFEPLRQDTLRWLEPYLNANRE